MVEAAADDYVARDPEDRLRILWLIKGLGRGGAEMLLYEAARLRDRSSFDCAVGYLLGSRDWMTAELRAEGVPVYLFPGERHGDFRWARRLRRHLKADPVDIIHVHSPLVAAVTRLVARTLPKPIRPRTISTEHLPWSGHRRPTRFVNAATFRLDAAHLAVSEAVLESIPRRLQPTVRVLIHGVPVDRIRAKRGEREAVRGELGVSAGEIVVATVANATQQKGYPDLMAAARRVVDAGLPVRFVVAGRGTADDGMRRMRDELGLSERMQLMGPIEDVPRLLTGCDVFCLASHWEGLPLVVMEAMATGLPIVATDVGGIPELIRSGAEGVLVPPARPDLLADALERMIREPALREELGAAAWSGATRFDNRGAVRAIEALYREVGGRTRAKASK